MINFKSAEFYIVRKYSFVADYVHEDQKLWHHLKLRIGVRMINVVPVVIKEAEEWTKES
jgi:hypothetical protein